LILASIQNYNTVQHQFFNDKNFVACLVFDVTEFITESVTESVLDPDDFWPDLNPDPTSQIVRTRIFFQQIRMFDWYDVFQICQIIVL
jgi:hypothetical protein